MQIMSFSNILSEAFSYFVNPWVLLLVILLLALYFGYELGILKVTDITLASAKADEPSAGPGCLIQFLGIFTQAFVVALFLLLLLPILMGVSSSIDWQQVEPLGFVAIRAGLLAMLSVTALSFIPWIGGQLAASPGLEFFTLATLTYRFMIPLYLEAYLKHSVVIGNIYPSYLKLACYFILTLVLTGILRWGMGKLKWNRGCYSIVEVLGALVVFFLIAAEVAIRSKILLN